MAPTPANSGRVRPLLVDLCAQAGRRRSRNMARLPLEVYAAGGRRDLRRMAADTSGAGAQVQAPDRSPTPGLRLGPVPSRRGASAEAPAVQDELLGVGG